MNIRLMTVAAAFAALMATSSTGNAQDSMDKGPGQSEHHRHHKKWGNGLEHMTKTLDLTAEQQTQIGQIIEQAKPQMKAAREEMKEKMKTIRANTRAQIRPLLTPAQQEKFDAMEKARENMRKAKKEMRDAERQ